MIKLIGLCRPIFRIVLLVAAIQGGSIALSSPIIIVPKTVDHTPEIRVQDQPTVPENYKEIPFIETAPPPPRVVSGSVLQMPLPMWAYVV